MTKRLQSGRVIVALAIVAVATISAYRLSTSLTVHEWGTFTTVAGEDGRAIDWYPLGGPTDLPCFVERLESRPGVFRQNAGETYAIIDKDTIPLRLITGKFAGIQLVFRGAPGFDYSTTRENVLGKVRMETPVIYFYSPTSSTANVQVEFPQGLMTEWYPHAAVAQDDVSTKTLRDTAKRATLSWSNIAIRPNPGLTPTSGTAASHYYAARETDAAPLSVNNQGEKFLFYRGIANFDVPLSARVVEEGAIDIRNLGAEAIPTVVLFESRHGKLGYRVVQGLKDSVTLQAPTLDGSLDSLRGALERSLVATGLYPKEAAAMVATWKDSWFEEGTRVFYIFPQRTVDAILPLKVDPVPANVVRTFVGRMEVLTPETISTVQRGMNNFDLNGLQPYARFFGPIGDRILASQKLTQSAAAERTKFNQIANSLLNEYVKRSAVCK